MPLALPLPLPLLLKPSPAVAWTPPPPEIPPKRAKMSACSLACFSMRRRMGGRGSSGRMGWNSKAPPAWGGTSGEGANVEGRG